MVRIIVVAKKRKAISSMILTTERFEGDGFLMKDASTKPKDEKEGLT
jgi:hypothetical protein